MLPLCAQRPGIAISSIPPIAQMVEQLPFKEKVLGSIPSGRTLYKLNKGILENRAVS